MKIESDVGNREEEDRSSYEAVVRLFDLGMDSEKELIRSDDSDCYEKRGSRKRDSAD